MAIAHHTAYLLWFELGRTEWIREAGISYAALEQEWGVLLPVIELAARYHQPARYDELLAIRTVLDGCTGVRVRFGYRIERAGTLLAEGSTQHAATGRDGRPRRLPAPVMETLLQWSRQAS